MFVMMTTIMKTVTLIITTLLILFMMIMIKMRMMMSMTVLIRMQCFSPLWQSMGQSARRCVKDRSRCTRKQPPVSSKRATGWERPPPTPQTPAASAGAAAVAAPGNTAPPPRSLGRRPTHSDIHGF